MGHAGNLSKPALNTTAADLPARAETMADRPNLIHVHGGELGLRRERRGSGFVVLDTHDEPVTDEATLARVNALRIPPAWTEVWIAASENAHLQATGIDTKGRRQYLYHPAWRERRDQEKF